MSPNSDMSPPAGDDLGLILFERHWLGETTPAEAAQVEAWFLAHPERQAWYAQFGAQLQADNCPHLSPDRWARLTETIVASSVRSGEKSFQGRIVSFPRRPAQESAGLAGGVAVKKLFGGRPRRDPGQHSLFRTVGFGVAAGAVFLVVGTTLVMWSRTGSLPSRAAASADIPMRDITTPRGRRASFTLADGSHVILDAGSRLRIPGDFGVANVGRKATRELYLEGQAYFDVHHDTAHPFRVHTAQGIAEDVGTAFVVTAYPEIRTTIVAVESGIVAFRKNATQAAAATPLLLTLVRGDVGRIDSTGAANLARDAKIVSYAAWTTGALPFDQVRLRDAVPQLSRWYDVEITVADAALADRPFTATFHAEPLSQVLRVLEIALDASAVMHGRTVTIARRPPPRT